MSSFDVTFQLVDSPVDKSESGGSIGGDTMVGVFRDFPFAKEIARAKEGATSPTIAFKRQGDGEEIAIWTDNAEMFDLCLVKNGKTSFLHNRSTAQVEEILLRFRTESVDAIRPAGLLRRWLGRKVQPPTVSNSGKLPRHDVSDRYRLAMSPEMVVSPLRLVGAIAAVIAIFVGLFVLGLKYPHPVGAFLLICSGVIWVWFVNRCLRRGFITIHSLRYSRKDSPVSYWFGLGSIILMGAYVLSVTCLVLIEGWTR